MNAEYIPGTCNIGPEEIALRRRSGVSSALATVILLAILLAVHASPVWRLVLFLPLTGAVLGFLQTYFHFCVGFGFGGIYNVLKPAGQSESVEKEEFRRADRAKAIKIVVYGLVLVGVVTWLIYLF